MADILFNLAMLAVDAAALAIVNRRRGWGGVLVGGAFAAVGAALLAGVFTVVLGWHPIFAPLRFSAWGVFAHGPLLLVGGAVILHEQRLFRFGLPACAVGVLAVGADAFVVEPHALGLRRFELTSPALTAPLRIGVIADLQTDAPGDYERRALLRLLAQEPDVILFAGDYVHQLSSEDRRRDWAAVNALFHEVGLAAPLGLHAVQGDVDPAGWHAVFAGLDVELYNASRSVTLEREDGAAPLTITGLSYADGRDTDLRLPRSPGYHIALAHRPDFALGDVEADLLVAGHTHGGQVRLPLVGPLITLSEVPRAWAEGLTALEGGRHLVVSRGVGMERGRAPRLRFLCRPELVVIDVLPE